MKGAVVACLAAIVLYLPTIRYGFVQDDRAIIASNPAAHSIGAAVLGVVFAWHPVNVEGVASLVGRAELLAAVGIFAAVLDARRGWWVAAVACAALAMLSKEHGIIAGVAILLDYWLQGAEGKRYPIGLWIGLAGVTIAFLGAWFAIGRAGASAVAAEFIARGGGGAPRGGPSS